MLYLFDFIGAVLVIYAAWHDSGFAFMMAVFGSITALFYTIGNGLNEMALFTWVLSAILTGIGYVRSTAASPSNKRLLP
jgi:hypothetical protein